jgi:organic hydroperoxide reductase OsmC/OhrA
MSGAAPEVLDDVADWAVEHCPVSEAVRRAVPLNVHRLE